MKHAGQRSNLTIKLFLEDVTFIGLKERSSRETPWNSAAGKKRETYALDQGSLVLTLRF